MTAPLVPSDASNADDREQQALHWFTRLRADDLSASERQAFAQWQQDADNARVFADVQALWQTLELPARRIRKHDQSKAQAQRRSWPLLATAASLLLAAGITGLQWPAVQRLGSDYATAAGERRDVVLADGSRLRLDSASAVDVDLGGASRRVHLRQGRLFADVTHDGRPFVVEVDQAQVQVLGTQFSVSREGDSDEVILLKGKVQVHAGADSRTLLPGQRLVVHGQRLDTPQAVDAERLLAWRDGQLRVRDVPLREVLQQLADYQGSRLLLLDANAGERLISGSFNLDQADNALDALANSQKLQVSTLAGQLIIVR